MAINASLLISSPDAGSKKRLSQYCANLRRDYDNRNFDRDVNKLIKPYLKGVWRHEFQRTEKYLRDLRSSADGKLYSQGVKEYAKLLKAGKQFSEPNHTYFGWNQHYKAAKNQMVEEFSKLHLKPLQYTCDDDIAKSLPKLDTHAGFTWILSGLKEKGMNLDGIHQRYLDELEQARQRGTFGKPNLVAVRTQGRGHAFDDDGNFTHDCDHKTRMVSMVDLIVIIAELTFAKPIQEYMAVCDWYAGGKDLDSGIGRIISGMRMHYSHWVSIDYSSFDVSVSAWLIHDAFEIIKAAFPVLEAYDSLFELVENDFVEKDFVFADEIIHSVRGVPSGSMFTQIVDSIVNRLVIQTYLNARGFHGRMIVMGDDNLCYTIEEIDRADLSSYIQKNFGMEVSADKTKFGPASHPPQFLSCEWWIEGRFREPHEVIGKLLYPERKRRYGKTRGTPQETLWSYVLAYPITMSRMIDVQRFLADNPTLSKSSLKNMGSHKLPGLIKYLRDYTYGFWSKAA